MDTITTVEARPYTGEVVERFLAGYWCARTRGQLPVHPHRLASLV
jgi:hypothetical protein